MLFKLFTHLFFCSLYSLFIFCSSALAAQHVDFSWLPNGEPNLAGYKIYYGPKSRSYLVSVDVGNPAVTDGAVHATVGGLADGTTYYFAATAYDTGGAESNYSQEVTWTSPTAETSASGDTVNSGPAEDSSPDVSNDNTAENNSDSKVISTPVKKSRLVFSPNVLTYFCSPHSGSTSQNLRIKDTGEGPISYTIDSDTEWLTFSHNFAESTAEYHVVTVDYNINRLSAGVYTGNISVSIIGEEDRSPLEIPVVVVIGDKIPVFNIWSEQYQSYFSTIDSDELKYITSNYPKHVWNYDDIAWFTYSEENAPPKASPVYRFWSDILMTHFYTISDSEKDFIIEAYSEDEWRFEGVAYYAYVEGDEPADAKPVYRFWSPERESHFFTIREADKDYIIENYSEDEWRFEGVAWYAYDEPH
jgi:hypothetical protein